MEIVMKKFVVIFLLSTSFCFSQILCNDFKNGYKDIKWNWSVSELKAHFKKQNYVLNEENIYKISNGKSAETYSFWYNDYSHYRSNDDFYVYTFIYVDEKMISLEFYTHFNWNYNYNMVENLALEIANKYSIPKRNEQNLAFGTKNVIWYDDCDNRRIILRLFWNPTIIYDNYSSGEVTRYIQMRIFLIDALEQYDEILSQYRKESREKQNNAILENF